MELFIILLAFCGIVGAVCVAGISTRMTKIQDLMEENLQKNREALASLETRLHQTNGYLIEIAALLRGQRPPA